MVRTLAGFARRHPLLIAGLVIAWWLWPSSSSSPPTPPPLDAPRVQAAVLADGFVASDGANRMVVLDGDGQRRRDVVVRGAERPRVVGASSKIAAIWRTGRQLSLALVRPDGTLGSVSHWGKNVQLECAGTASNDRQFAAGWTEPDGAVWFVYGPTSAKQVVEAASAPPADEPAALAKPTFCAVASADDKIALLWNDKDRWLTIKCGKKCPGMSVNVQLPKHHEVLGFGCTRDACVIATRHDRALYATWSDAKGKALWTKPLRDGDPAGRVELVGTGTQVAIAYATPTEPVVVAAAKSGTLAPVWQGAAEGVPSIQWSSGRLVIARQVGGELVGSVARVP